MAASNSGEPASQPASSVPPSLSMGSCAPLLRSALPGGRSGGARTPRLGLAIPAKSPTPTLGRPSLSTLQLPSATKGVTTANSAGFSSAGTGSESSTTHSRSGSFGPMDGRISIPTSAASQFSSRSFDPFSSELGDDPTSTDAESGLRGLEAFDRLTLDRVRDQDVEDLDEDGWKIVSIEKRVVELSNLGEGAGGAVTKCKLKGGTTLFAFKIITSNPDPDVRKQILRELKFNKKCRDPHICRYYGAFEDPSTSTLSIAMEFCEGGSLDKIYKEVRRLGGRTGEKVLGKISEAVLRGLTYLHGERIIHRDVKPSNILICRNGDVKLCDFGVSGIFGTKGEADTFIGTSYYMAPERITGQPYTITSDVWSTGVTLLEVAQHRFPFPADGTDAQPKAGLLDLLTYIVRQPVPCLKDEPDQNISWSEAFKYFIACCLEKDPNRRGRPWKMLEHPWMVDMAAKRVNMGRYVAQVWGWEETEVHSPETEHLGRHSLDRK